METVFSGKVWRFEGVMDVDWEICPVEHLSAFRESSTETYEQKTRELGHYCMTTVDPEFPRKVEFGDIIVGGDGFGYGHDHDHACMSLRGAGVAAVLCERSNINFMRNAIHHGLPVVEVGGIINGTVAGDRLDVDLAQGTVHNLTSGELFRFVPYPDFLVEIIQLGGLYRQMEEQVKAGEFSKQPEGRDQ